MDSMAVTLTIKQVPERLAAQLRSRAATSHRSLQGELMAIITAAVADSVRVAAAPDAPVYAAQSEGRRKATGKKEISLHGPKLTLAEAWELSRKLGPPSKSESTAIIRAARDGRYGR